MSEPAESVMQRVRGWVARLPRQPRNVVLTCAYALGGSAVALAFQMAMNAIYQAGLVRLSHQSLPVFLGGSFAVTVGTALVAGSLIAFLARDAAGSGIPQLKRAFWTDFGFASRRTTWVKFIAAALQIGGGSSLGREGPSVQLAGAVASHLARAAGEAKQRHRRAAATGAAAGLAAAFNTPLAAVTFVLEEIIGDLNSRLLGGVLLAGMIGALVVHSVLGPQPAFAIDPVGEPTWRAHLVVPIVAAAAALIGAAFQKLALGLRGWCRERRPVPRLALPAVGAAICWALGALVFAETGHLGVFGLGYEDLSAALAGSLSWPLAFILLTAKFGATVACYGTGGSGGIFSPTLFFGGMAGLAIGGMLQPVLGLTSGGLALLAIVGMSATLGAVVRAPVTGILIVFEMTHDFALVPPLMLAALVGQAISRRLMPENFYDALLAQDGQRIEHIVLPRDLRAWQDQPVERFATRRIVAAEALAPSSIRELLDRHPYQRFPVMREGQLAGVLLRAEADAALRENREPHLSPVLTCAADERVRDAASRLVQTSTGILVIIAPGSAEIAGLFTLHDLLRAQLAAAEHHASLE